ncbi:MAG: sulfatase [Planctomycetota bacterium]|jgi:arylsulfatase A-like enzyme
MRQRRIVYLASLLLLGAAATASAAKRPDVLFIAIDDMNDWTTLFDKKNPIKTPNLERLAGRGVFFDRAYCASAACTPSRTAIITGLQPFNSGVYSNSHCSPDRFPKVTTLPKYLSKHGYETWSAGKILHHNPRVIQELEKPMFDHHMGMLPARKPKSGRNHNGYTRGKLGMIWWDWGLHDQKLIDLDTVEWVEKAMDARSTKPRFVAAGIFKPHLPFYADAETFKKYPLDRTVQPPMPPDDHNDIPPIGIQMSRKEHFIWQSTTRQPPNHPGSLRRMVQCYQASADFADQMIGRLIKKLDSTGRAEDTIIILWADHGYHLGDKKACVKFTLWEKANRVPFIIVAPGFKKGVVCSRPVSLVDIYPTLVELAGLPANRLNDGTSLVLLLKDPKRKWKPAVMTMKEGNHAIRSDRWRYIRYHDGTEELYDHSKDPWEWKNLARDPRYAGIIAEHKKYLPKK